MSAINRLFVEREVAELPRTRSLIQRWGLAPELTDGSRRVYAHVASHPDPVGRGKEVLYLTRNRGPFIRKCPGTRHYLCCDYQILHIGTFCTMDCAYCILQSYFHPPVLQFFVNYSRMWTELEALFSRPAIARVGTGEFTDSLIWEQKTGLSRRLVPCFAGQRTAVLELKSKTTDIDGLKALPHNRKTILAWSVNTPRVIAGEERGTASLEARLRAAARAQSWGYPLAFHFDPMIVYEGCQAEYQAVVDAIFAHVDPENIVWISLGTFRFMPDLKGIIRQRFPGSRIQYGEFITGMDDKMRYFKPLRLELYQRVVARIRSRAPAVCLYFCMEDETIWQKVMGFVPEKEGGVARLLDESAVRHCDLDPGLLRESRPSGWSFPVPD